MYLQCIITHFKSYFRQLFNLFKKNFYLFSLEPGRADVEILATKKSGSGTLSATPLICSASKH